MNVHHSWSECPFCYSVATAGTNGRVLALKLVLRSVYACPSVCQAIEKDLVKAKKYFEAAAAQGDSRAQLQLAMLEAEQQQKEQVAAVIYMQGAFCAAHGSNLASLVPHGATT